LTDYKDSGVDIQAGDIIRMLFSYRCQRSYAVVNTGIPGVYAKVYE